MWATDATALVKVCQNYIGHHSYTDHNYVDTDARALATVCRLPPSVLLARMLPALPAVDYQNCHRSMRAWYAHKSAASFARRTV